MAKAQGTAQVSVNEFSGSLHTDNEPINQPKQSYRFALNVVNQTKDSGHTAKANEASNYTSVIFPTGFIPLGKRYIEDDLNVVILKNELTGYEQIGTIDKNNVYTTIVNTKVLKLSVRFMCQIIYRLRRGNNRIIYWVDALNVARTFNLSKPYNFHNNVYQDYLQAGGDPNTFVGEKWDVSSFNLIKTYASVPFFAEAFIRETGNILSGSYNFAIQYVDEDLNPTAWITTSNTVNIFADSITQNAYGVIRGSRGNNTISQTFPRTSKSIRLQITNLDKNFPFYRVAIIPSTDGTGIPTQAFASDIISTGEPYFLYTGNDSELTKVNLLDILIEKEVILAPEHIEQIENRLVLFNTEGNPVPFCEFQKFASKIKSDFTTKPVILNDTASKPNVKNVNSTFIYRGNMPGEVYSYGIVYVADDWQSPAFHIPGKHLSETTSKMKYHQIDNKYLPIHECVTNDYWGVDYSGHPLINKPIRHHRFPFREDVETNVHKPLVTTIPSGFVTHRYKLQIVFSLNPAYTPGPPTYPVDGSGNPIPIAYTVQYRKLGAVTASSYSGVLTKDMITGLTIVTIYDDIEELILTGGVYVILDPTCDLASYKSGSTYLFIVTGNYSTYDVTATTPVDTSEIFGINFSNIQRPHPDVKGFYIVRNERLEDDKMIVDNAIFGPTTMYAEYISFGLINPKPYYPANNCGRAETPTKTLLYNDKTAWFFSPEFHYYQKEMDFDTTKIEGIYEETSMNMPSVCYGGPGGDIQYGTKGVYIEDVQAGTSFNPELHKNKDAGDDGFDLVIGYRNINVQYTPNSTGMVFPQKKQVIRLASTANKVIDSKIYYNVSTDNRISMMLAGTGTFDITKFINPSTGKSSLIYAALVKNNTSSYSNFINRPYYKEHNNPIPFPPSGITNTEIFNGDAQISATNFVSTVFYKMVLATLEKKSKVWKIIVGSVLVVASIVATILTAGGATPAVIGAVSALASAAISYGVALVTSGLKFEQFKKMIDEDYEKGLIETVTDGGVFETIRDSIGTADDTIRWFSDRVSNMYMETSVPMGLRVDTTAGVPDFTDAPVQYSEEMFRSYLSEKLTVLDRDQGSGRLYKGFASAEFYDANKDYARFNKEKEYIHLPIEFDCCAKESFPMRNWYSEQSFQEELIDNYRVFLPNNYKDIEGEHGEGTNLYRLGNSLFIHTKEALWELPTNAQERVIGDIVSFIGTGAFFSIPPRKILDDAMGSGGTSHKWGTLKTAFGVIFVSEIEHKIFLHGAKLQDISSLGNREWFNNNLIGFLDKQLYRKFNINHVNNNNPVNEGGTGYISVFDAKNKRAIITKRDYLVVEEKINSLIIVPDVPTTGSAFSYCLADGRFYQGTTRLLDNNTDYFQNKSWTISFSFHRNEWIGWHSYLPDFYIQTKDTFYSYISNVDALWKHDRLGHFQNFYGKRYPCIIEYVKLTNPLRDLSFEDILLQTEARTYDFTLQQWLDRRYITFSSMMVYNSRQNNGDQALIVKETQPNPSGYLRQQVVNTSKSVLISKNGKDWHINGGLRDYVDNYTSPMFTKGWNSTKNQYYIDKVLNMGAINFNKSWHQLETFKDKYAIIRLKFDTFDDVNLLLNYSIQSEESTD